jgi:hypothetical protein
MSINKDMAPVIAFNTRVELMLKQHVKMAYEAQKHMLAEVDGQLYVPAV